MIIRDSSSPIEIYFTNKKWFVFSFFIISPSRYFLNNNAKNKSSNRASSISRCIFINFLEIIVHWRIFFGQHQTIFPFLHRPILYDSCKTKNKSSESCLFLLLSLVNFSYFHLCIFSLFYGNQHFSFQKSTVQYAKFYPAQTTNRMSLLQFRRIFSRDEQKGRRSSKNSLIFPFTFSRFLSFFQRTSTRKYIINLNPPSLLLFFRYYPPCC